MEYIVHRRFKKLSMRAKRVNIPYGTAAYTIGDIIHITGGEPICYTTSENAKLHFARNDDGNGLERGKLTYAIAYAPRKGDGKFRFTGAERRMLARDWGKFLRTDTNMLLFNDDFFGADINELRTLAAALNIRR